MVIALCRPEIQPLSSKCASNLWPCCGAPSGEAAVVDSTYKPKFCQFVVKFQQNLHKFLHPRYHFSAFFKIYKILQNSVKILQTFCKILQCFELFLKSKSVSIFFQNSVIFFCQILVKFQQNLHKCLHPI